MKRIYKLIVWILFIGAFLLIFFYFGFEQLLLNVLLLNLVAYVVRSVSIDIFQSLVKNLLVRYIFILIINIIWLIFPFWLLFLASDIYFIAIVSFLVVAISLTFQNVINNIASGVMLLSSGGFEVGDLVETNGIIGLVKEIGLNNLKLVDFDGSITYIPNKIAFSSSVVRYTHKPLQKEKKMEISDVVKSISKIITGEKKLTRYIKVVEILSSIDSEQLEELIKPIFDKYERIFGIRPYFYANNTVSGVNIRLSITLQILTEDPKLILTYIDPFMKEILYKVYEKDINYGLKVHEKINKELPGGI